MPFRRPAKTLDEAALYEYAVGALARRMRSVAELKRLLRPRAADEALVETVVSRLKDQKFLNDSAYAAAYSSYRRENQKLGRRRVVQDLQARGVHPEVIAKSVSAAYAGVREESLAREFLARKRMRRPSNPKDAARLFRTLVRAGFAAGVALGILKKWQVDEELLSSFSDEMEHKD